jgi:hypothetical protein
MVIRATILLDCCKFILSILDALKSLSPFPQCDDTYGSQTDLQ